MLAGASIQQPPLCPAKWMLIQPSDTAPGLSHHQHPTTIFFFFSVYRHKKTTHSHQADGVWQRGTEIRQWRSRKVEATLLQHAWMSEDFPGRRRAIDTFQKTFCWDSAQHNLPFGFRLVKQPGKIEDFHVLRERSVTRAVSHELCHMTIKSQSCRAQSLWTFRPRQDELFKNVFMTLRWSVVDLKLHLISSVVHLLTCLCLTSG